MASLLLSVSARVGDSIGVPGLVGMPDAGRVADRCVTKALAMQRGPSYVAHDSFPQDTIARGLVAKVGA